MLCFRKSTQLVRSDAWARWKRVFYADTKEWDPLISLTCKLRLWIWKPTAEMHSLVDQRRHGMYECKQLDLKFRTGVYIYVSQSKVRYYSPNLARNLVRRYSSANQNRSFRSWICSYHLYSKRTWSKAGLWSGDADCMDTGNRCLQGSGTFWVVLLQTNLIIYTIRETLDTYSAPITERYNQFEKAVAEVLSEWRTYFAELLNNDKGSPTSSLPFISWARPAHLYRLTHPRGSTKCNQRHEEQQGCRTRFCSDCWSPSMRCSSDGECDAHILRRCLQYAYPAWPVYHQRDCAPAKERGP